MAKAQVIFRVDGNANLGLGHLVRSRALAEILRPDFDCTFVTRASDPASVADLARAGFATLTLPDTLSWEADAAQVCDQIARPGDIVVVDGYAFDGAYQEFVKARGFTLVAIDDLHQGRFHADAVINHSGGVAASAYKAAPDTRFYFGPAYSLLRAPFLDAIPVAREPGKVESLLICFGGSDPRDLSRKALSAAAEVAALRRIEVVVGAAYRERDSLAQFAEQIRARRQITVEISVNLDASGMLRAIRASQLAVASPSTVAYEICAVKSGLVVCPYVDNQEDIARFLETTGAAACLRHFPELSETKIRDFLAAAADPAQIQRQIAAQAKMFAGNVRANLRGVFAALRTPKSSP